MPKQARTGFSGDGQKISELPERGKTTPTTKKQNLQGTSFERASPDDLRADISKSHQSLLKTLASKAGEAGCRELTHWLCG